MNETVESISIPPIEIGPIKIEDGVRYLVGISIPGHLRAETVQLLRDQFGTGLRQWWDSGEKFFCVVLEDGAKFIVERISADEVEAKRAMIESSKSST